MVGEELLQESASFSQLQHTGVGATAYQDESCGRRRWRYGLGAGERVWRWEVTQADVESVFAACGG